MCNPIEDARAIIALLDESGSHTCAIVRRHLTPQVAKPTPEGPMTHDERKAFERERMPFGQHMDMMVGDIPRDYLCWVNDQNLRFRRDLRRYLTPCIS